MSLRHITPEDIEAVIRSPERTITEATVVLYDGVVRGAGVRVVVDRDDPTWVVTVMRRRG